MTPEERKNMPKKWVNRDEAVEARGGGARQSVKFAHRCTTLH